MYSLNIFLKSVLFSILLGFCLSSSSYANDKIKILQEAKMAIEKSLEFQDIKDNVTYDYCSKKLIEEINKILEKYRASSVPANIIPEHTAIEGPIPVQKLSLEDRFKKLHSDIPWLSDVDLIIPLRMAWSTDGTIGLYPEFKSFLLKYSELVNEFESQAPFYDFIGKRPKLDEKILTELEKMTNDLKKFNFQNVKHISLFSNILPLMKKLGITENDLKNKEISRDLWRLWDDWYHKGGKGAYEIEQQISHRFAKYKSSGIYQ